MSLDHEILKIAAEIAENLEASTARFDNEIAKLETQAAQIKAKRDLARSAAKRLANYEVKFRGYYQCPSCWIEREMRSPLTPMGNGTNLEDFFRCTECNRKFPIPIRR